MADTTSSASKTSLPLRVVKSIAFGGEIQEWSAEQVRFTEQARRASRRALWFLRTVERNSEEPLRTHAQKGAHTQLIAVRIPAAAECCDPTKAGSDCGYSGAREPFSTLVADWEKAIADLAPTTAPRSSKDLGAVEKNIVRFIRNSRPKSWFLSITYSYVPMLRRLMIQHMGLIVTLLIGLAVCGFVEAVRSILRNAARFTGFAFLVAIVPSLIMIGAGLLFYARRGKAAPWNLGGRVVHRFPISLEPEPWVPWHPEGYAGKIYFSLLIKVLLHMAIWIALGYVVYLATRFGGVDQVVLTIYLIVMLWAFVVLIGGALDFADMHSPSPLRWMMLAGVGVVAFVVVMLDSAPAEYAAIGVWVLLMALWSFRIRNHRTMGFPIALALVALIGAYFTDARQQEEVWRPQTTLDTAVTQADWPRGGQSDGPVVVMAASGGGSRAAIFTARTLEALEARTPLVAENLQAISSVSGGSLANAVYISRRLRRAGIIPDTSATCRATSVSDAVSRDFIQPTIIGLWHRGGRGMGIQNEWERCPVGLADISIVKLAQSWRQSTAPKAAFPLPLFNSTSLERNAVVISPLDQAFFTSSFDSSARGNDNEYRVLMQGDATGQTVPTWVFYRSGIYHLRDLSGGINAPLSRAVRASANFPFGFPLVEVEARKRLHYSTTAGRADLDSAPKMVHLTDGGALSNSGMWPLVPLLLNQRQKIGNNRGVLLIVVDASRMPVAGWTDRQRGLLGTILDKNPKGERLHLQMLEQLEAAYGGCFGYAYIGIEPKEEFNVYTTWALDRKSLAKVGVAFDSAWAKLEPQLKSEFERLRTCENNKRVPLRPRRVPLS
ncbi:MAG: patatin-like phospholipase family protein [Gemmatimonadaceae bacterium]